MNKEIFLELKNISKVFPGVKALNSVNLKIYSGEVHALMGENGAGKSTLMNVIIGNYQPDEGEIYLHGEKVNFDRVEDSIHAGIGLVHQENSLLEYLDVKSNLFLGHFPSTMGFVNEKDIYSQTMKLFEQLGIEGISPDELVRNLSTANRQLVEIAKAISINPRLLLLDEPTASLTEKETVVLFKIIQKLVANGVAVVYISHRMDEIFKISDKITVLRDGGWVMTGDSKELTKESLVSYMVGRSLDNQMHAIMNNRSQVIKDEIVIKVEHLSRKGEFEDISFEVKKGEVLGIGGLVGAGRTELLETIFGYREKTGGQIWIKGKQVNIRHPSDAIRQKMAFIPEDRKNKGLSLIASVRDNMNIVTMKTYRKGLLLNEYKQNVVAKEYIKKLNIKTPTSEKAAGQLSGGNQQKIIISRWLQTKPDILLLDEPTHGIDVGAKAEIYKIIEDLTKEGLSVILVSSEMTELLLMSDRIMVMREGKVTGVLDKDLTNQEEILTHASSPDKK